MLSYENKDAVVSLTNRLGDIFKLFQKVSLKRLNWNVLYWKTLVMA